MGLTEESRYADRGTLKDPEVLKSLSLYFDNLFNANLNRRDIARLGKKIFLLRKEKNK
jgi:hypothetical protein